MGIFSLSSELKNIVAGNQQVKNIMAGTGNDAKEVWSYRKYPQYKDYSGFSVSGTGETNIEKVTIEEDGWFTITHWLYRSGSNSARPLIKSVRGNGGGITGSSTLGYTTAVTAFFRTGDVVTFSMSHTTAVSGITGKWSIESAQPVMPWENATSSPVRVAFVGGDEIFGGSLPQHEGVPHALMARISRHVPGAQTKPLEARNSGSLASPTVKGFHFFRTAFQDKKAANYLNSNQSSLLYGWNPHVMIHVVGGNDYRAQTPLASYQDSLRTKLGEFTSASMIHVLVHSYRPKSRADTDITWAQYGNALKEVSEEFSQAVFIDVSQSFESRQEYGFTYLQADNYNLTYKGSELLAQCIADELSLNLNVGRTVWGVDAADSRVSPNSLVPTRDSMVQQTAAAHQANKVDIFNSNGKRLLTFNNSGARYADINDFGGAYSFPMVAFFVVDSFGGDATFVQPYFYSYEGEQDGWWWAWRDKDTAEQRAAMNSKFSDPVDLDVSLPRIIAFQMMPNGRCRVYVNSTAPLGELSPDRIDTSLGPWMKSLRLGASADKQIHTAMRIAEASFEFAGFDNDYVGTRMKDLGRKHSISITGGKREFLWTETMDTAASWIPQAGSTQLVSGGQSRSDISGIWRYNKTLPSKFSLDFYIGALPTSGPNSVRVGVVNAAFDRSEFISIPRAANITSASGTYALAKGDILTVEWDGSKGRTFHNGRVIVVNGNKPLEPGASITGMTYYPSVAPTGAGSLPITEVRAYSLS